MRTIVVLLLCCGLLMSGEEAKPKALDLSAVPAPVFLALIREPLRADSWGEFTGRLDYKGANVKRSGTLRVRLTFSPESMSTQIVLNEVNVYALEQTHKKGEKVTSKLEKPETETAPGLFQFGVEPTDLTFAFLYWEFLEEKHPEQGKAGKCRVMLLKEPGTERTARVWFNVSYGFPEKVAWYEKGATQPCRQLEMKGAKRYENGLWFVKEMKLNGTDWKCRVMFDHVSLNEVGE